MVQIVSQLPYSQIRVWRTLISRYNRAGMEADRPEQEFAFPRFLKVDEMPRNVWPVCGQMWAKPNGNFTKWEAHP